MKLPNLRTLAATAVTAAALAAGPASAQGFDTVRLVPVEQDVGTVGAVLSSGPRYAGSDERRLAVLPVLDYQWASGWFAGTAQGVGYKFHQEGLQFGPRLSLDLGRPESRSARLRGLGDVNPSLEAGGFVNWSPMRGLTLSSSLRAGSGEDHRGARVAAGAAYTWEPALGTRVRFGLGATWANAAWQQTYHGITAEQAARSGLPVYRPGSGLQETRASVEVAQHFTRQFFVMAQLNSTRLEGDARNSPLTRRANATQGMLAALYFF